MACDGVNVNFGNYVTSSQTFVSQEWDAIVCIRKSELVRSMHTVMSLRYITCLALIHNCYVPPPCC